MNQQQENHKFWTTQPIMQNRLFKKEEAVIDTSDNIIVKEQPILPPDFKWDVIDMQDDKQRAEVTDFLQLYYVTDKDNQFKLFYTNEFLKWYFKIESICICVRIAKNNKLIGFISGIKAKTQINRFQMDILEVDFLCVHPKLRGKRLAEVLIKELIRVGQANGYKQAIYSGEKKLPVPFCKVKYYHRAINIDKLIDVKFTTPQEGSRRKDLRKAYYLADKPNNRFIKINENHIDSAMNALNKYMLKYNVHPVHTKETFQHLFLNDFVTTYVTEDNDGNVIDMISYYKLDYKIVSKKKNKKIKFIKAAYLLYYTSNYETLYFLLRNMMIIAKQEKMDVFNATNLMETNDVLRDLGFIEGTGVLNYYIYNWKLHPLNNCQVAKIFF